MSHRPIAMIDLAARHAEVAQDVESRVLAVLRSGHWVGGPVVAEAEAALAARFGAAFAVGVNSGTDALALALQAADVGPGDEVVVPALSFQATAGAVLMLGAVPVVVDVTPEATLDPALALQAVTDRTRAIVPVHLFGNLAPALHTDLVVIDDSAQAVGCSPPALIGLAAAVSTYPTKLWGSAGDGGFVVTQHAHIADKVRRLGHHGYDARSNAFQTVGSAHARNSRLDPIQAAVLLGHEPRLGPRIAHRQHLARLYDEGLCGIARALPRTAGSSVQQYCILHPERDRARVHLAEQGIGSRVYYDYTLDQTPGTVCRTATPTADLLRSQLLALPCHLGVSELDVERVCDALRAL